MTMYQECHHHYGYLTRETEMARELLERCGKPTPQTVKDLRSETDMPMAECARMLRCMWRDMELERLQEENAKLRTALSAVLQCNGITKRDKGCDACPMYDKEKEYEWAGDWCGIKRFIYELGIEE